MGLKSAKSKFGGDVVCPGKFLSDIKSALGKDGSGFASYHFFHENEHIENDVYRVKIGDISFLYDDGEEDAITFLWRSPEIDSIVCCRVRRLDNFVTDCDDLKNNPRMAKYTRHLYYVSDKEACLKFHSFSKTVSMDEKEEGTTVHWTKGPQIATSTEGWSRVLRRSAPIGVVPIMEGEDWTTKFYADKLDPAYSNPKDEWQRVFSQSIINAGAYIPFLNDNHFPVSNEMLPLRKSLVLTNKLKVVMKFPGDLFGRKDSDYVYLIVTYPKETYGGIGNMLFGDLSVSRNKPSMEEVARYCADFLNGNESAVRGLSGMRILGRDKLKEPFLLDPGMYVKY